MEYHFITEFKKYKRVYITESQSQYMYAGRIPPDIIPESNSLYVKEIRQHQCAYVFKIEFPERRIAHLGITTLECIDVLTTDDAKHTYFKNTQKDFLLTEINKCFTVTPNLALDAWAIRKRYPEKQHTKEKADFLVWLLRKLISKETRLIGSLGRGELLSDHDIDVLIPDRTNTHYMKDKLFDLLDATEVVDTDWGGFYFRDTYFGDVDVFFSTKDFDY